MLSDFFGPTTLWALGWVLAAAKFIGAVWAVAFTFFLWYKTWQRADQYAKQAELLRFRRESRDEAIHCRHMFAMLDAVGFGIELAFTTAALLLLGVEPTTIVMINLISGAVVALWITRKYITLLPNPRRLIMGGVHATAS
jgi:hypothetical protein